MENKKNKILYCILYYCIGYKCIFVYVRLIKLKIYCLYLEFIERNFFLFHNLFHSRDFSFNLNYTTKFKNLKKKFCYPRLSKPKYITIYI